jgi:hypothetical protein
MTPFETDGSTGIRFRKELIHQDNFDSVMAPLGRLISLSTFLEQFYRSLIAHLLRCHEHESALIVCRTIRGFAAVVALTEQLFAVNFPDQKDAQSELKDIGKIAKGLQERRDECVHSLWYPSLQTTGSPALRYKDKKNAEPVSVKAADLIALSTDFDNCILNLTNLMDRQHFPERLEGAR